MKKNIYHLLLVGAFLLCGISNQAFAGISNPTDFYVESESGVNEAVTNEDVNPIKVNVGSNVTLSNDFSTPSPAYFFYEGFGHTINGNDNKGIVDLNSNSTYINNLTLDNFKNTYRMTMTDSGDTYDYNLGGAVYSEGTLNVYNSTFSNNSALEPVGSTAKYIAGMGGAICSRRDLTIYDSHFNTNTSDTNGGAITAYGDNLYVSDSTFDGNVTNAHTNSNSNNNGGAIYTEAGTTNVSRSTFTNNESKGDGGAISVYEYAEATISDSTFESNKATGGNGGAISNNEELIVSDSTFTGNSASNNGGAVYNSKSLNINNSTFTSNIATGNGGAINNAGTLVVTNSTFGSESEHMHYNRAGSGGAIYNTGTASIHDSSFFGNRSLTMPGGAVLSTSGATMYLIANNEKMQFLNNQALTNYGGAIRNSGNLFLVANTAGALFSGNTAFSNMGNAIYSNVGNLYLNAGIGDIIFNDNLYVEQTLSINGIVNVDLDNDGALDDTAPTTGRVVLNSDLSGNGNVAVNGGMLQVGASGLIGVAGNQIGVLQFGNGISESSTILNLANGNATDTVYATSMTVSSNNTTSIWMDMDVYGEQADRISASGAFNINTGGTLKLATIRMLSDATDTDAVPLTVATYSVNVDGDFTAALATYTNKYIYDITTGPFTLTFTRNDTVVDGLEEALINSAGDAERSFSLVGEDYTTPASITALSNGTLTIFGAGTGDTDFAIKGGDTAYNTSNHQLLNIALGGTAYIIDAILKNGYAAAINPVIYNNQGNLYIYDSLISYNLNDSSRGGAIYNQGNTYIKGTTFSDNKATNSGNGFGGAIYAHNGNLEIYNSDFNDNSAAQGGAIYHNFGALTISDSRFTDNSSTLGGAINNGILGAILNIYGSTFTSNDASSYGGAIYNDDSGIVDIYNSSFILNSATFAGGIYNVSSDSEVNIYNSLFDRNEATAGNGGTIYNLDGTVTVSGSTFTGNTASISGGAISNCGGALTVSNSTFKNNTATTGNGGAIVSWGTSTVSIADSTFGGDLESDGNTAVNGGAIYNEDTTMKIQNSVFKNNSASSSGGAIYNASALTVQNSKFLNNSATSKGGAIYNGGGGTLNIIASGGNTIFSGNTTGASKTPNDIYLASGTLNLNSSYGNIIYLGGGIKTVGSNNAININPTGIMEYNGVDNAPTSGEVILAAPIEGTSADVHPNVNLNRGILTLRNDSYLDNSDLSINYGLLNLVNNQVGVVDLNSLSLVGNSGYLAIDADLANGVSDRITAKTVSITPNACITISSVNLLSDATSSSTTTQLIDNSIANNVTVKLEATKAYTPIYKYDISYDNSNGKLAFAGGGGGGGGYNPAILSSPVSANVGAYMSQVNVYNEVLNRSDSLMSLPYSERLLMKHNNKYAAAGTSDVQPEVFSPTFLPEGRGGLWFKQYTTFENVGLKNGPNVNNTGYGAMVGADTPLTPLGHGCEGYLTAYAAYTGSHQYYDSVGVNQNGGALGITGTLYKGNLFTALTASVGDSAGTANTMYGNDNFNTLLAGLAWKTGYNIETLKGRLIFQPSFLTSYTFANTFDYNTASGVNITSDPLHAIQIAPGIKLIGNLKNGWQPYVGVNMVWNFMDDQKFYANNAALPQMSVEPYVEYGAGIQRRWGERFTGFGQAMLRDGGRNGIALQFGFRVAVGKKNK